MSTQNSTGPTVPLTTPSTTTSHIQSSKIIASSPLCLEKQPLHPRPLGDDDVGQPAKNSGIPRAVLGDEDVRAVGNAVHLRLDVSKGRVGSNGPKGFLDRAS